MHVHVGGFKLGECRQVMMFGDLINFQCNLATQMYEIQLRCTFYEYFLVVEQRGYT